MRKMQCVYLLLMANIMYLIKRINIVSGLTIYGCTEKKQKEFQ